MFQNVNFTVEIFYFENVFAKGHEISKGHGISKAGKNQWDKANGNFLENIGSPT